MAAAAISATAVLGFDLASAGAVQNLDVAALVGGLALSQMENDGPVGEVLRTVGNATEFAIKKIAVPGAKAAVDFYADKKVGLRSRALLELGIESAIYALDPKRKQREEEARKRAEEVAKAAFEAARKEALPFWNLGKHL